MPQVLACLSVNREHLLRALKQIKRLRLTGEQPALLTYANGELEISLCGCSFRVEASGDWRGQLKAPVSFIQMSAVAPPGGDGPIAISTDGESVKMGFVVAKCKWTALAYPRIELPLDATLLDKLVLRLAYSTEDIERSDLKKTVEAAESERDRLIKKAVGMLAELDNFLEKAAEALWPLGIKEVEIRALLNGVAATAISPPDFEMRESEIRRLLDDRLREMLDGEVRSGDQYECGLSASRTQREQSFLASSEDLLNKNYDALVDAMRMWNASATEEQRANGPTTEDLLRIGLHRLRQTPRR